MKFVNFQLVGIALDVPAEVDELRSSLGTVLFDELAVELVGEFVNEMAELDIQAGLAVHARVTPALGGLFTARARNRREGFGLFGFNVEAVGAGNLAVAGVLKDGDIARGDATPARPSVVLFEDGLVDAARGEITGRGLSEVRQRDGLVDASLVGSAPEDFSKQLIADGAGIVELRPQGRARVLARGVVFEPPLEVGNARNERDRPLSGLSVDGDFEAVVVVGDVADAEASELAGARPRIPRDGDDCLTTAIARGFDHRQDILFPEEHVAGVRRGLVISRRVRGDPLDAIGDVVAIGDVLGEHPQRDAVIPVGFLVIVLAVNPPNDVLGGFAVVERGSEAADFFGDADRAPQEMFVTVVAIARGKEVHLVGEGHERVGVIGREVSSGIDALSEALDALARFFRHADQSNTRWNVNPGCETPTEHYPDGCITAHNRQTAVASAGVENGGASA